MEEESSDRAAVGVDGFLCTAAPVEMFEWAGLRAVDGVAVTSNPLGQVVKAGRCSRGGFRRGMWGPTFRRKLPPLLAMSASFLIRSSLLLKLWSFLFVAPVVVHGHAGFPVNAGEAGGGDFLLWGAKVAGVLLALGHAELAAAFVDAVVDDDVGLELPDVRGEVLAAGGGPGALPLAVEPEDADGAVVGEEFGDLVS